MRIEFVDEDGSMTFTETVADWSIFPLCFQKKKIGSTSLSSKVWCWAETLYWNVAVRPSLQKK